MITNEAQKQYAKGLVDHAEAITVELDKYPEDVRVFMRANFQMALYPLSFLREFAAKLDAFRPR